MYHPSPSRPQESIRHDLFEKERHAQGKPDKYAKIRNLPDSKPATQPSGWKATLRRSICCIEPSSPSLSNESSPEVDTGRHRGRKDQVIPSWSSSLDECISTSDRAHQDVVNELREMMNYVNADDQACLQHQTQPQPRAQRPHALPRPDSQAISELNSHASLHSMRSVSEVGAVLESAWWSPADDVDARARHDPSLALAPKVPSTAFAEIEGHEWDSITGGHRKKRPEAPVRSAKPSHKSFGSLLSSPPRPKAQRLFQLHPFNPKKAHRSDPKKLDGSDGMYSDKEVVGAPETRSKPRASPYSFAARVGSRQNSLRKPSPLSKVLEPEDNIEREATDHYPAITAKRLSQTLSIEADHETEEEPEEVPEEEPVITTTHKQQPDSWTENGDAFSPEIIQRYSQLTLLDLEELDSIQPMASSPPLIALLYFSLELPRAYDDHRGAYVRHFQHPMRLPLSTNRHIHASIAHLRGYLTHEPARFLSHFSSAAANGIKATPLCSESGGRQQKLLVNFPDLFSAARASSVVRETWGPELRFAWADASEERFAEAVVGVLRNIVEGRMRKGMGGVVDVTCIVRRVVHGTGGYGLPMDVRRIVRDEPQPRRAGQPGNRASSGIVRDKPQPRKAGQSGKRASSGSRMSIN